MKTVRSAIIITKAKFSDNFLVHLSNMEQSSFWSYWREKKKTKQSNHRKNHEKQRKQPSLEVVLYFNIWQHTKQ